MSQEAPSLFYVPVDLETIKSAKVMRAERDRRYGNIFLEKTSDLRWVGEVGEIMFDRWLGSMGITHQWITENVAGNADFKVRSTSVGVKTVKRKVPIFAGYTAQITARHAHEPVQEFFFMSFEEPRSLLWFLGGLPKAQFLAEAKYYKAGDWIHSNYQVRPGHEIYNIEIVKLIAPEQWLHSLS